MEFLRYSLLLSTAALTYHSNAAPTAPPGNAFSAGLQRISQPSLADHPQFAIRIYPRPNIPVNPLSMLTIALDALTAIGLTDSRMRSPPMHFQSPGHPHLVIDMKPKRPARDIVNEVATLCIYYGVADLAFRHQYTEAVFNCIWDNVNVAEVIISRGLSPIVTTNTTTTNSLNALGDQFRPLFFYFNSAQEIDITSAFITAMNAIRLFSPRGSSEVLTGSINADPGPQWDSSILFPSEGRPVRIVPPFFEYRYVIFSMRLAIVYMFEHGRFAELGITYRVDGIIVGSAILIKGKPASDSIRMLNAGVATA
ncbi:MAG: hypothetical protein Q9221_003003 [Calogaya cf. arnoldii]